MIDSHCHLDLPPLLERLDEVLTRATAVGVTDIIVPAVSRRHWANLERLSQRHANIHIGIGLHPCFNHNHHTEADIDALAQRLGEPHPYVAVGECGLDSVNGLLPLAAQLTLCRQQIECANIHNLPVIFHVRSAHNEMLRLLNEVKPIAGGVIHGFSGNIELANQYIRRGLHIGIGGVFTYPRAKKTIEAVKHLPLQSILFETDSPDMPLNGFQGQTNQPHQIEKIVIHASLLRSQSVETLLKAQCDNCRKLFPLANL